MSDQKWRRQFFQVTQRFTDNVKLFRKGLETPRKIPSFILGKLLPNSRWSPSWYWDDGVVKFDFDGYSDGVTSRAKVSARTYHDIRQLNRLLPRNQYDRSLEIGCGYGRMSGWLADKAATSVAIEPNAEALAKARSHYPNIEFVETTGAHIPYSDGYFDLIVSWEVLGHVPSASLAETVAEIKRVLSTNGTLVLCERVAGEQARGAWIRSQAEYEALFDDYDLLTVEPRETERTSENETRRDVMVFANGAN